MEGLHIVGLNLDIVWKDKISNFKIIEAQLEDVEASIFLLPEMFSTGFCMEAEEIADRNLETLTWMKDFAKRKNAAVVGSASVEEKAVFFNRFYFVKPLGEVVYYDKRHLFSYSGEDTIYTPGEDRVIVEYGGVRILLQVCYDLRFPVFARNRGDYDVVFYVANWPESRVDAWRTLLKARSIENQAYVFGLNRIGTDGNNLSYEESSDCYFPDGSIVSTKKGSLVEVNVDIEKLKAFRERFQFLNDADDFQLRETR